MHRTFSLRVKGGEQKDEERDETELGLALGNEETKTGSEQGPGHLGEGEEQQRSSSEGVDGEQGGESKDEAKKVKRGSLARTPGRSVRGKLT